MRRKFIYLFISLLFVLLVSVFQLTFGSKVGQKQNPAPEEKCEQECGDQFKECASIYGADACRPMFDLCKKESPKGPKNSGRRSGR